jgi:hypothetical protein
MTGSADVRFGLRIHLAADTDKKARHVAGLKEFGRGQD